MQTIKAYIAQIKIGMISLSLLMLTRKIVKLKKTYLDYPRQLSLIENFRLAKKRSTSELHAAEFGVGRGGSALLLAWLINRFGGKLTLFDVFGRIPAPSSADGEDAQVRFEKIMQEENANYYGNIPNLLEVLKQEIGSVCSLDQISFVQGKYEDTLQQYNKFESFDLVHIDCDWYESVREVLEFLERHQKPGIIIQIDDYAFWPSTQKVTDEAKWLKNFSRKLVSGALIIDTAHLNSN